MKEKKFTPKTVLFSLLVVFSLIVAVSATAATITKVAVTSDGQTASASVSSSGARSSYFLMFDGNGRFIEAIPNPHKDARSGAGDLVVKFLARSGVQAAVAQNFGDKMVKAMKSSGINYFEFKGSANDAVNKLLKLK